MLFKKTILTLTIGSLVLLSGSCLAMGTYEDEYTSYKNNQNQVKSYKTKVISEQKQKPSTLSTLGIIKPGLFIAGGILAARYAHLIGRHNERLSFHEFNVKLDDKRSKPCVSIDMSYNFIGRIFSRFCYLGSALCLYIGYKSINNLKKQHEELLMKRIEMMKSKPSSLTDDNQKPAQ